MSQYEYTEMQMDDAYNSAQEYVLGREESIKDAFVGECGDATELYSVISWIAVCQEKYRDSHIDKLIDLLTNMLSKQIEKRTEIELDLL